jgi:hypothetical protein
LGPNTGLGHTSVVMMAESQIELAIDAIMHMRARALKALEPRRAIQAAYVREIDSKMRGTVWSSGGCSSWYIDRTGRNSSLWPSYTFSFMRRARFRAREYTFAAEGGRTSHAE